MEYYSRKIRLALAIDAQNVPEEFCTALRGVPSVEIVATACSSSEAVEHALNLLPDVLVVDAFLHGISVLDACHILHREAPGVRVIVLTSFANVAYRRKLYEAGVCCCTAPPRSVRELIDEIQEVFLDSLPPHEEFVWRLYWEYRSGRIQESDACGHEDVHSEDEKRVRAYVGEGLTNTQIAERMIISLGMIKYYRSLMTRKPKKFINPFL